MDRILEYENLVWSIVRKYDSYFDKDDLYQVGMIGLINASKNFNGELETKFSTYAYTYIFGEISKYVRDSRTIKVSRDLVKLNRSIDAGRDVLRQRLLREPSDFEVSIFLEIDENQIKEAKSSCEMIKSLDEMVGDEISLYNSVKTVDKETDSGILDLKAELQKLEEEDKKIIYSRYFMDLTQSEVSKDLGISQVQVSRKETKVLNKLKTRL